MWAEREDRIPDVRAREPAAGPRMKTPERRLVWRRMRLLLGGRTAAPSADLLVDELPVEEADLMSRREGGILESHYSLKIAGGIADLYSHLPLQFFIGGQ